MKSFAAILALASTAAAFTPQTQSTVSRQALLVKSITQDG
jgi:hypothetical protein